MYNSIKYNYYHLTNKLSKIKHVDNYRKFLGNKYKSEYNMYFIKYEIIPFFIYFVVILSLFLIQYTRCSLVIWVNHLHNTIPFKDLSECNSDKDDETEKEFKFKLADLLKNVIHFSEMIAYIYILFLTNKFPMTKDYFKLFKEFDLILCIWLFFDNIMPLIMIGFPKFIIMNDIADYLCNSARTFSLLMVFFIANYTRKNIKIVDFKLLIENFNNFMNFPPFHKHFQDFIFYNNEGDMKYLDFWIDYKILDNKIFRKNLILHSTENNEEIILKVNREIKKKVTEIYKKYFGSIISFNKSDLSLKSEFKIDFPIDMQEKVEEILANYQNNFVLEEIYEESYNFVCHHLSNIHSELIVKDKDVLEKMLYVINFFELEEESESSENESF